MPPRRQPSEAGLPAPRILGLEASAVSAVQETEGRRNRHHDKVCLHFLLCGQCYKTIYDHKAFLLKSLFCRYTLFQILIL
jgi:hypothetical protein